MMPERSRAPFISDENAEILVQYLKLNYSALRETKHLTKRIAVGWERIKNKLMYVKIREISRMDRMFIYSYLNLRCPKRIKTLLFVITEMAALVECGKTKNNIRIALELINSINALKDKLKLFLQICERTSQNRLV